MIYRRYREKCKTTWSRIDWVTKTKFNNIRDSDSVVKNGFRGWPLTLKVLPSFGSKISTTPWGETFWTMYGPDHLVLSLPGKRWSLVLYNRTFYPETKFFLWIDLSWKILALCLDIRALSYASFRSSSNLDISSFVKSLALSKSKLSYFNAHIARCSNSTGRWQDFPNTTRYRDIPRTVL